MGQGQDTGDHPRGDENINSTLFPATLSQLRWLLAAGQISAKVGNQFIVLTVDRELTYRTMKLFNWGGFCGGRAEWLCEEDKCLHALDFT